MRFSFIFDKVSARRAEWQEKLVFIDIPEPPPNLRRQAKVSASECRDASFSFWLCRIIAQARAEAKLAWIMPSAADNLKEMPPNLRRRRKRVQASVESSIICLFCLQTAVMRTLWTGHKGRLGVTKLWKNTRKKLSAGHKKPSKAPKYRFWRNKLRKVAAVIRTKFMGIRTIFSVLIPVNA